MKRVLQRTLPIVLLTLSMVCFAPLAQAMPGGGRFAQRQAQGSEQQGFLREAPPSFQRRDGGSTGEAARPQRLSPEERRQLRRDIHEAGRDIYSPRR